MKKKKKKRITLFRLICLLVYFYFLIFHCLFLKEHNQQLKLCLHILYHLFHRVFFWLLFRFQIQQTQNFCLNRNKKLNLKKKID